jgi:hypothetical protein
MLLHIGSLNCNNKIYKFIQVYAMHLYNQGALKTQQLLHLVC